MKHTSPAVDVCLDIIFTAISFERLLRVYDIAHFVNKILYKYLYKLRLQLLNENNFRLFFFMKLFFENKIPLYALLNFAAIYCNYVNVKL